MLHGSSTTWFQTSRYCRAKVEFNSSNWVQHGISTTFETGFRLQFTALWITCFCFTFIIEENTFSKENALWSCSKHSKHVIYPGLKLLALHARIFWPVTNHNLWSVSLAKNSRKYVCITPPSRLENEAWGLERSSSYTRVACEESTEENHITFFFIKSDVTWPLRANGLFLWCDIQMKPLQQYFHMVLFV